MSFEVPASSLTTDELGKLANFRREIADALDAALINAVGSGVDNMPVFNVKLSPYNAVGDGVANDTPAIRAAVAAAIAAGGGTVYFPNGTYLIQENGSSFQCISVTGSRVAFLGQSKNAVLKLKPTQRSSVRMIYCGPNVTDISFKTLKLDGNRPNQTDQTGLAHNDAIFLDRCTRVLMDDVEITQAAASGVVFYTNSTDLTVRHCYIHDCGWNAISVGDPGGQLNVTVRDSRLEANLGGGFHVEVSQSNNAILLSRVYMQAPSGVGALEVTGNNVGGSTTWSDYVTVHACKIVGCALIGEVTGFRMVDTTVLCSDTTGLAAVKVTGQGSDVIIARCHIVFTTAATGNIAVWLSGDANNIMNDLYLLDTDVEVQNTAADGVFIQQCKRCTIRGGTINGNAGMTAGHYGVNVDCVTAPDQGVIRVIETHISDFQYGVIAKSAGNPFPGPGNLIIAELHVINCVFNAITGGVMTAGISADQNGNHPVRSMIAIGNELIGITTLFATYPTVPFIVGGSRGGICQWSGTGAPGTLSSATGSLYHRRDGGAGTSLYVNESAGGSGTTWAAK